MSEEIESTQEELDERVEIFQIEKKSGGDFKNRRVVDWDDTYTLYRDRPILNRIVQRQSINIPLMKYGINTVMKDFADTPDLYFSNLDNDQQAEIFYNEHWREVAQRQKLAIKDSIFKKLTFLFGRAFYKLNIENGRPTLEVIDPRDLIVHRFTEPSDIDSADCIIQQHIYKTFTWITTNEDYDKAAREKVKLYYSEDSHSVEQDDTMSGMVAQAERTAQLGVPDAFSPLVGETYIELNEEFRREYDKKLKKFRIMFRVFAVTGSGAICLFEKPLAEHMGKPTVGDFWEDHHIFSTAAADPERTDFWSDGVGDILRTPNKLINSWISQQAENRTLRNFGMMFYDSSNPEFIPQTFLPEPFGFYPVPGKPQDVMMPMQIPDLSNTLQDIQYIIGIAEKASAATSTQAGQITGGSHITYGELQLALANAEQRVRLMRVYVDDCYKDLGVKYTKLLESSGDLLNPVKISKKGRLTTKMYTKVITQKDWKAKLGYRVEVTSEADKEKKDIETIQKLDTAKLAMQGNIPLEDIYNKKVLQLSGLTPEEVSAVLEFQKQLREQMATQQNMLGQPGLPGQPTQPQPGQNPQTPAQSKQPSPNEPQGAPLPAMPKLGNNSAL